MPKTLKERIQTNSNISDVINDERKHKTSLLTLFEDGLVEIVFDESKGSTVPPTTKNPDEHFRWDILRSKRIEKIRTSFTSNLSEMEVKVLLHSKDSKEFKDYIVKVFEENI